MCDIQGVLTGPAELTITDPQIHTPAKSTDFGVGNGEDEASIRAFFASHECKATCRHLGLAHPFKEDLATGIASVLSSYAWRPFFERKAYWTSAVLHTRLFGGSSVPPARREKAD